MKIRSAALDCMYSFIWLKLLLGSLCTLEDCLSSFCFKENQIPQVKIFLLQSFDYQFLKNWAVKSSGYQRANMNWQQVKGANIHYDLVHEMFKFPVIAISYFSKIKMWKAKMYSTITYHEVGS